MGNPQEGVSIAAVRSGIQCTLQDGIPDLKSCMVSGERVKTLATPSAMVNMLHFDRAEGQDGSGQLCVRFRWEVVVVLPFKATDAELQDLAAAVAVLVDGARFGLQAVSPARFLDARESEFAPEYEGSKEWRVEFEQDAVLGENAWSGDGVTPEEVYLSYSPQIGAAHVNDYQQVEELPDVP